MSNFLGYGSPEALESAIRDQESSHLVVYEVIGLCFASVCSDLPQEEVEKRMKARLSGTTGGWQLASHETFASGQPNPSPCDQQPTTHKHYLFSA